MPDGTRPGGAQPDRRRVPPLLVLTLTVAASSAAACGGLHVARFDAGADAGHGVGDGAVLPDADRPGEPDAGVPDADGDADGVDGTDRHWLRQIASPGRITSIAPLVDGGAVVAGDDGIVARLDAAGHPLWTRAGGRQVAVSTEGQVVALAAGSIVALDLEDGAILGAVGFSPRPSAMAMLPDGSVVLASGLELWRYSFADGPSWSRRLVTSESIGAFSTALAANDWGIVFLGLGLGHGGGSVLAALSSEGDLLWDGRLDDGTVRSMAATGDGGLVVAGLKDAYSGQDGLWVARLDADGTPLWAFGSGSYVPWVVDSEGRQTLVDGAVDAAVGASGEILVVGYSTTIGPPSQALALWLDRDGTLLRSLVVTSPDALLEHDSGGEASAAAAMPGGGWLVGGGYATSPPGVLASLDAEGTVGQPCSSLRDDFELRVHEPFVDPMRPLEATLEEGAVELVPAEADDTAHVTEVRLVCR